MSLRLTRRSFGFHRLRSGYRLARRSEAHARLEAIGEKKVR
jgi:hypothetical protein